MSRCRFNSPDVVLTAWVLMDHTSYVEARPYTGMLIYCQSYYNDYTCFCDRVAMSDDDGTTFSTQVPVVTSVWTPVAVSCHAKH
jgi:hypothetical protein